MALVRRSTVGEAVAAISHFNCTDQLVS